jgi:hypothetical protein
MDNSIYQARWLLMPLFALCVGVFAAGALLV